MMRRLLMGLVRGYRLLLSPWLGSACRFEPTCSAYSLQALEQYGAAAGSYLTVRRLARCHPWCWKSAERWMNSCGLSAWKVSPAPFPIISPAAWRSAWGWRAR